MLNITKVIKKMSINVIRDFIFENYYKHIEFFKESSYYLMKHLKKQDLLLLANKLIENITDHHNAKEHYQSFIRKKNRKSVKQSEIITYQPKSFGNVDIISVITEHPKTSHILSKTIRKAEKVGSNSDIWYIVVQKKSENFLSEKNIKNKTETCF